VGQAFLERPPSSFCYQLATNVTPPKVIAPAELAPGMGGPPISGISRSRFALASEKIERPAFHRWSFVIATAPAWLQIGGLRKLNKPDADRGGVGQAR
jgi:hypothetical protein